MRPADFLFDFIDVVFSVIGLSEGKIKRFGAGFMTSIAAGKRAERQLKELIVTKIAK